MALPVFPSRMFRHQSIYVNSGSGIREPADLIGKRVGIPEYQLTAVVWQRGILAEHHGVPVESVRYFTGGMEQAGRVEKLKLNLPPEISVTPIDRDQTLSALLAAGELDAIYSAGEPVGFGALPQIGRLFEDLQSVEAGYYRKTGIFPIMHVIAVKRALFEQRPWIARSLTKAFGAALDIAYADLAQRNALKVMLPWLARHLEETTSVLGPRYWDYGLQANRHVLETFSPTRTSRDSPPGPGRPRRSCWHRRATHSCSDRRPRSGSCSDRPPSPLRCSQHRGLTEPEDGHGNLPSAAPLACLPGWNVGGSE